MIVHCQARTRQDSVIPHYSLVHRDDHSDRRLKHSRTYYHYRRLYQTMPHHLSVLHQLLSMHKQQTCQVSCIRREIHTFEVYLTLSCLRLKSLMHLYHTWNFASSADKCNQKLLSPDEFPGLWCHRKALAAGTLPWTPLREPLAGFEVTTLTSFFDALSDGKGKGREGVGEVRG